ncbi:hypothetical protein [Leptospira ilyithenensis]|uniref:Uncharacterized protein n=1 Tax=Leptospira ilyithenensis TaxID=2484901 RepID=A0A4R9LLA6_9LEPT|nr:hypothetical protein [Leptospira ilyithenensis]TGN07025.1 hypothetical protein EHS11_18035 [Leptospira ilyithenensis]
MIVSFVFGLDAETKEKEEDFQKRSFEFNIRRQYSTYIPLAAQKEYDFYKKDQSTGMKDEYFSINAKYHIYSINSYIEFNYFNLALTDLKISYFYFPPYSPGDVYYTAGNLGTIKRNEQELNFIHKIQVGSFSLGAGAGLRRIGYENREGYFFLTNYLYRVNSIGAQINFRSEWRFIDQLSLSFDIDAFYLRGTRVYQRNRVGSPGSVFIANDNDGTTMFTQGFELDLALNYYVTENFKLFVGGNKIDSKYSLKKEYIDNFSTFYGYSSYNREGNYSSQREDIKTLYWGIGFKI